MPRNNGVLCLKGTHVFARRRANRRLYVSLLFFAETELWPLLKWRNKVSKWGNKLEIVSVLRLNKSNRGSGASMMMGSFVQKLGFMRWKKLLVWCKCSFLSQTFKIYPPTQSPNEAPSSWIRNCLTETGLTEFAKQSVSSSLPHSCINSSWVSECVCFWVCVSRCMSFCASMHPSPSVCLSFCLQKNKLASFWPSLFFGWCSRLLSFAKQSFFKTTTTSHLLGLVLRPTCWFFPSQMGTLSKV